jgi:intracellular sulfur oxidation DsrE/DsrF family protein
MARRIASLLRNAPGALRATDPALEANAYAVAEDVDLTVVLRGDAVEFALAGSEARPTRVAGVALPPAAGSQDLRGLLESGVRVVVDSAALTSRGVTHEQLIGGVDIADDDEIATVLASAEGVLTW